MGSMRIATWSLLGLISAGCLEQLGAETHTLTLQQALERARAQNAEVLLARFDARKAAEAVRLQQDPFYPKVFAGTGIAYTSGFPMSIEGSAPSIVQARAVASLYDKPQKLRVAESREQARGAGIAVESRQQEAVLRTVELYFDLAHAGRSLTPARDGAESASRVEQVVKARVEEGREIPLAARQAALDTAKARQATVRLEQNARVLGSALAEVLGYPAGDEVQPAAEPALLPELPQEAAAIQAAYGENAELRRLDSDVTARRIAIRAAGAARLPRVNLLAQYGLFAKFNNYEDFFRKFQRNNGQIGLSVELPLWVGVAAKAQKSQAEIDIERLAVEANRVRARIAVDVRRDYAALREAEVNRDVARLDLDVARESLEVTRARLEEGRAALADLERARQLEAQKWLVYYDALHAVDRSRYAVAARAGLLK
jgi:outer membrane protein TolC